MFFMTKISTKNLPKSLVEVTIEADENALDSYREEALARLGKEVKLDGFRTGQIPADKLIEHVGEPLIERETLDLAVKALYTEAVKKEDLQVVAPPDVKVESVKPLKFVATVAVLPTVTLGDYKSIKLSREEIKLDDKEVTTFIDQIRKQHAKVKPVTDRAAKQGDKVEIDFAGTTPDGVALDGTQSKNHPLTLGEGNFIPGFEEGVIGLEVGSEKEHLVKFPAEYHAKHLAGKDVKFKIKLNKIEEFELPELNDEFAKLASAGRKEKWTEVGADIREYLTKQKENQTQEKLTNSLIQELLKICQVEVPEALIREEVQFMLTDLKQRITRGGLTWEKYLEHAKKKEDELTKEMQPEAEKRVKIRLILNKLLEVEKIDISDDELTAEVERMKMGQPEEQAKKIAEEYASLSQNSLRLKHQLKVIKLLRTLTTNLSK